MAIPNSYDILQAVIEATPDAIFVKDLEGRYVLVNAAFARFIGKSAAEIAGKNDFELYPEPDARAFVEEHGLTYPMLRDGGSDSSEAFGVVGYPETFVIDRGGRIVAATHGPVDDSDLRRQVLPLLREKAS